jgi:hypothetical protein
MRTVLQRAAEGDEEGRLTGLSLLLPSVQWIVGSDIGDSQKNRFHSSINRFLGL